MRPDEWVIAYFMLPEILLSACSCGLHSTFYCHGFNEDGSFIEFADISLGSRVDFGNGVICQYMDLFLFDGSTKIRDKILLLQDPLLRLAP